MAVLNQVKPEKVFHFFEELCQIPHGTFDTKRISDYCVAFAKERGLEVQQDEANDVIIKKPGTKGYEDSEPVILQGHLDMVCEKTPDSDHDFKTDGLDLYVEDGYVKAKGTTLGGDDGIAIAMAMAVLDSSDIPHPPIEAVFTVDEETGMGGAEAVDLSGLKGKKLLNIDSEEEGVLTSGCAGGIVFETKIPVEREDRTGTKIRVKVHGLLGGHSGNEIHRQRGNAHKMMGRLLYRIQQEVPISLISINGGSKDNVIASESEAVFLAEPEKEARYLGDDRRDEGNLAAGIYGRGTHSGSNLWSRGNCKGSGYDKRKRGTCDHVFDALSRWASGIQQETEGPGRDFFKYRRGRDLRGYRPDGPSDPQFCRKQKTAASGTIGAVRQSRRRNHPDHQPVSRMAV